MSQRKRAVPRHKRRVMVRYGLEKLERTAFTTSLALLGTAIKTNHVFSPGTTILVEVRLGNDSFTHWARVAWAKKVPPQLAHTLDCGMGLQFLEPTSEWAAAFERWTTKAT